MVQVWRKKLRIITAVLCILAISFALLPKVARADSSTGVELRGFLHDIVVASGAAPGKERAQSYRVLVASHPEVLGWLAKGESPGEVLQKAGLSNLIRSGSLSAEVMGQLSQFLSQDSTSRKLWIKALSGLEVGYDALTVDQRLDLMKRVDDAVLNQLGDSVTHAIEGIKVSDTPAIQMIVDPNEGLSIPGSPDEMKGLFTDFLHGYFDQLPVVDKRRMVAEYLLLPPDAPVEKQLAVALNNAGPALQKLFQLFAKDAKSAVLKGAMTELLASVKPFDGEIAKKRVEASLSKPFEEVFSDFRLEPLGAGTIGQVHLATLRDSGRKVVIKIRRPGVAEQAEREITLFKSMTDGSPAQLDVVEKIGQTLRAELDYSEEYKNLLQGQVYNQPKLGISAVRSVPEITSSNDIIAMEFTEGVNPSKLGDEQLVNHGKAIENLLSFWTDEALFHSGFFHGDLHAGNLFFKEAPGQNPPFELTLIDFGNADTLSLAQRQGFAKLLVGSLTNKAEQIADGLEGISPMTAEQKDEFTQKVSGLKLESQSLSSKINSTLEAAMDSGVEIPASLLKFNRGRLFLEYQLQEINERLALIDPGGNIARFDIDRAYVRIASKSAIKQLARQIIRPSARKASTLTWDLVFDYFKYRKKIVTSRLKGGCGFLFRNAAPPEAP